MIARVSPDISPQIAVFFVPIEFSRNTQHQQFGFKTRNSQHRKIEEASSISLWHSSRYKTLI